MQLILKPLSHPELGEIAIDDCLFAIGRHEPPFSEYPPQHTAKLSRRHARIFEQDGAVYLVDLGSLNGTTVNGQLLAREPVALHDGDEICLAGYLAYRCQQVAGKQSLAAPPVVVTLVPEKAGVEPIVIGQFPFMVSKADEAFARYRSVFPDEVRFLSRRHAHIFLREGQPFVEDLGSTNGTFVSGQRLDEHAVALHEGAVLAFGGDHFVYRVHIDRPADITGEPTGAELSQLTENIEQADVTRTTFVTSADSFLDIFCADDEEDEQPAEAESEVADTGGTATLPAGRVGRAGVFVRELRAAFGGLGGGGRRALSVAAGIVLVAAAVWGYVHWQGAPEREIRALLEAGDLARAAERAGTLAADRADDPAVRQLATEALMRYTVPEWADRVQAGRFDDAHAWLERMRELAHDNQEAGALLGLLDWVSDLEAYVAARGGSGAPLRLFRDEAPLAALLDWWEEDIAAHRRMASRISVYAPEFDRIRPLAFSHLRMLRSEKSLFLPAIAELKQAVAAALAAGELDAMAERLDAFEDQFPRIQGLEGLRADLARYRELQELRARQDWVRAMAFLNGKPFVTPIFQRQAEALQAGILPPPEVVARFGQADALWQAGELEQALRVLEELADGPWGEGAGQELLRRRTLVDAFRALDEAQGKADYTEQLLGFYGSLRPEVDRYFVQAVEAQVSTHRKRVLADADRALSSARKAWSDYRQRGGIRGLERLQARISKRYREQARRLREAYAESRRAAHAFRLTGTELPEAVQALVDQVANEVQLQRRSLEELGMVLEPDLLRAKLELLPPAEIRIPPAPSAGAG